MSVSVAVGEISGAASHKLQSFTPINCKFHQEFTHKLQVLSVRLHSGLSIATSLDSSIKYVGRPARHAQFAMTHPGPP